MEDKVTYPDRLYMCPPGYERRGEYCVLKGLSQEEAEAAIYKMQHGKEMQKPRRKLISKAFGVQIIADLE